MICPNCGAEITNGDEFCNSCGTHEKYSENSEQGKKNLCSNCGMEFGSDDIFCGHCGARLNEFIVKGEDEQAQGEQEEKEEPARKAQDEARRKRRNQILAWVFVLGMLVVGLVMLLVFFIIMFLIADFYSI